MSSSTSRSMIHSVTGQGILVKGPPGRRPERWSPVITTAVMSGASFRAPATPATPASSRGPTPAGAPAPRDHRPQLGILMQGSPDTNAPFGIHTIFAESVTRLAHSESVDVVGIAPEGVDLAANHVQGYRWLGPDRGWAAVRTEFPDVLWNRYLRRDQEHLIKALQAEGIPFINSGSLDKWEACRCLTEYGGAIREHLPCTRLLTDSRVVLEMLGEYRVIYIKPVCGSVGRGIIRMERESPGTMRLTYVSRETDAMRQTYTTEEQLGRWLGGSQRNGRFIVQQGLALTIVDGRPADVRALVQKDGAGRWQLTGMGARLAGHGRFTANLHTGGDGMPVEKLAEVVAPDSKARQEALIAELEWLALQAAQVAEQGAGPMGEIGLDLGVDQRGRTWYIEQNGQPGRAIFEHLRRGDLAELAHLRPVQYARHLAGRKTARVARYVAT